MTKILIEVRGGNVVAVSATQEDVQLCIVDYDNIDEGNNPVCVSDPLGPDATFEPGKAHELFTDSSDPVEMEVKEELKRIKF